MSMLSLNSYNEFFLVLLHFCVFLLLLRRRYRDPIERLTLRDVRSYLWQCLVNFILFVATHAMYVRYPEDLIWISAYYAAYLWIVTYCAYYSIMHHMHIPFSEGPFFMFIRLLQAVRGDDVSWATKWWQDVRKRARVIEINLMVDKQITKLISSVYVYIDEQPIDSNVRINELIREILQLWRRGISQIQERLFPKDEAVFFEQVGGQSAILEKELEETLSTYASAPVEAQLTLLKQAVLRLGTTTSQEFAALATSKWIQKNLDAQRKQ